jgi:hypothetical protein
MKTQKRRVGRVVGIAFAAAYFAVVAMLTLAKAATPLGTAISWAQVILGPAITVGSCLLLLSALIWIEHVIRG